MSNTVFVIKNQQGLYLSKQQEWSDGLDGLSLYRTRHRDEAINTVFEVSSRDIYLRAETVVCEVDAKGNPILATATALTTAPAVTSFDSDDEPEPEIDPASSAEQPPEEPPQEIGEPIEPSIAQSIDEPPTDDVDHLET